MSEYELIQLVAAIIGRSKHLVAFTGTGISVESGVPPFRGKDGIWNTYDPDVLELDSFVRHPERSWPVIKEMFSSLLPVDGVLAVQPNAAHCILADWETQGLLKAVITQNIDGLHRLAGSRRVLEYHGSCRTQTCLSCGNRLPLDAETTAASVPRCRCGGLLKPDFVFFGEHIPAKVMQEAETEASVADCMLLIGTSGIVYPAAALPVRAKENGATIIEINPDMSVHSNGVVDFHIPLGACAAMKQIRDALKAVGAPPGSQK